MPMTLEDLIEAVRRLADSNFATAAALNKLLPAWEQLRRDIYDIKNDREIDQDKLNIAINKLNTDLVRLLDDGKRTQTDLRELQRDVTSPHLKLPPPDNRSTAERLIEKFEGMRTSTKLWIFALVLVIVGGFGLHVILAALGFGG